MRHVFVTACLCLLTSSGSIAAEQKIFQDRFDGTKATAGVPEIGVSIREKTPEIPLDPQRTEQKSVELKIGMPSFAELTDRPISIPQQSGTSDLLQPRDLPPPPAAKPKIVVQRSTEEVCDTLAQAAQQNNLPAPFFIRLLFQESGFRPGIVSHAGAQGIAQFMPETAASLGLDNPFDPLQAIPASAKLLRNLIDKFGNLGLAAAAYNAGPRRIQNWLASKGKLPNETQGYVKVITGRPAESWRGKKNPGTATNLPARAPCKETVTVTASNEPEVAPAPESKPSRSARRRVPAAKMQVAAAQQQVAVAKKQVAVARKPAAKSSVSLAARAHKHAPARSRLALR